MSDVATQEQQAPEIPRTLRPRAWLVGLGGGAVAALLGGAGLLNQQLMVGALVVVQLGLVAAWHSVLAAPGRRGGMVIGAGAAIAADIVLASRDLHPAGGLMGVLALSLVASMLHQLMRRPRRFVAASLAAEMSGVALVLCLACVQGLTSDSVGRAALLTFTFTLAASLPVGRFIDQRTSFLPLGVDSQRGILGLIGGLAVAVGVGALVGNARPELGVSGGELLAGITALVAYIADATTIRAANDLQLRDKRRVASLRPLAVLLPIAMAAPATYIVGRILLG